MINTTKLENLVKESEEIRENFFNVQFSNVCDKCFGQGSQSEVTEVGVVEVRCEKCNGSGKQYGK